ncbi:cytochrome c family protein [Fulvimarina sp. 2208YS6-2-32]|uniref:Cytochrome c family protein n=1 Tax=Fulvimarina uroteuthidis TaxID=3098149 RepID=A0ABU5I3E2_9HYPH|nr:cytochrome c family protein [Fulvimarina sp. 2208YS6-2-32]MDY8109867.1 cytochrome c family protein [Fulvimarina sp. 2208YS6-2-32]
MDSLQFNKISGAVLGTVFLMFGGSLVAEGIFHSEAPETPGFEIVVAEADTGGEAGGSEEAAVEPIAARLQTASAEDGATQFRKCTACHSAEEGGANKIGPGLWSVVNRPIASHEGFSYSGAMTDFSEGGSVVWDYEHLDGFLADPKGYVSGTVMGFAGIKDPQDRADTIAYLRSLASEPAPLPEAPVEGEETGAAEGEPAQTSPGTTTMTGSETDDANLQAAGTTDPDTANAMPGQSQAPVLSEENQPETLSNEIQESGDAAPAEAPAAAAEAPAPAAEAPAAEAPATEAPAEPASEAPAASADEASTTPAGGAEVAAADPAAGAGVVEVSGDAEAGAAIFRRCQACHKVGEGASNGIGPELNGIMGEKPGVVEGYSFSAAFTEWAADKDAWTPELMTTWLTDPRGTVSGTKMAFAGLKNQDDIDNVIAYLNQYNEDGTTK